MTTTREIIGRLAELVRQAATSFRKHEDSSLDKIKKESAELKDEIAGLNEKEMAGKLESARINADRVIAGVEEKIKQGILFSERAVKELDILFDGLSGYAININDFLVTGNEVLKKHIKEDAEKYAKYSREFATMHEERLIKGVCVPQSSSMYLDMLNGLSGIFYHLARLTE